MLAFHPEISTTPEPWILLPPLYALREGGVFSEYNHTMTRKALDDLCQNLPRGRRDYFEAVGNFGRTLYEKLAPESRYFLDKTPRYHVISEEIVKVFPDGIFVVLFRNPLSILASIISTWNPIHLYRFDLYLGLEKLIRTAELYAKQVSILTYEDLVMNPDRELQTLCKHLGIEYIERMVSPVDEDVIPRGKFGNPSRDGITNEVIFQEVSSRPIDTWKKILAQNVIRANWGRNYLQWIGKERLQIMGYDYSELSDQLDNLSVGWSQLGGDLTRIIRGMLSMSLEPEIIRQKLNKLPDLKKIFPHQ
jgi:hypothetical protein